MSVFFVLVVRARYIEWKELRKGRKSNSSTISNCSKLHGFCTFFDGSLTSTGKVGRISIVKSISGWRVGVHARLMPTMAASVKQKIQQLFGSRKVPTAKEILRSKVRIPRVPIKQAHTHTRHRLFWGSVCLEMRLEPKQRGKNKQQKFADFGEGSNQTFRIYPSFLDSELPDEVFWSWNPILSAFFRMKNGERSDIFIQHTIHLWCVYRDLVDSYGKCK